MCQCTVRTGLGSVQYWKRVVAASCMSTILIDWLDVIHRAIKIICRSTLSRLHSVYLPSYITALHNQWVYKSTWIIHIQELLSDKIALSSVTQHYIYMYIHDAINERLAALFYFRAAVLVIVKSYHMSVCCQYSLFTKHLLWDLLKLIYYYSFWFMGRVLIIRQGD